MGITQEQLEALELEAQLDARRAAEMENLESKAPAQLLGLYNRRVTEVEMATSMEALRQAERDVEILTKAIIARMS